MGELLGRKRLVGPKSGRNALLRVGTPLSLVVGICLIGPIRPIGRIEPIPTSCMVSGLIPASRFPDRSLSKALPAHLPGRQSFALSGFRPTD
jgi:hypothetical protein